MVHYGNVKNNEIYHIKVKPLIYNKKSNLQLLGINFGTLRVIKHQFYDTSNTLKN
jgi:hypothetical protein